MKGRSQSGQRGKIEEARRVVQQALGDTARPGQPEGPSKFVQTETPEPVPPKSEAVYVLTVGEVAARLGITRGEVERMIAAGKLRALETGFTMMVPTNEVERLRRQRST